MSEISGEAQDAIIDEQIEAFSRLGRKFEWKVYALDKPGDLRERLEKRGFTSDPMEIFMIFPLNQEIVIAPTEPEIEIRRIRDESGVGDLVAIQEVLYGRSFAWRGAELMDALSHSSEGISLYGAYVGGKAVGCARATFPRECRFAGLFGGSVLPEFRQRGIYSSLLVRRANEARERGYEFLAVDAAPMSRPILEGKGFIRICETWPMRLPN